ncbi:hypothetical protein ABTY20_32745, partial [Streptomyces sp. NPDC126497]
MTMTTPPVPENLPEPGGPVDGDPAAVRPVRLIHAESTTEIPVHLLFRDAPAPAPVRLEPAVVTRRPDAEGPLPPGRTTGERPR